MRPSQSLPSMSPNPSPPTSPTNVATRVASEPRSVSWSIADESPHCGSVTFQLEELPAPSQKCQFEDTEEMDVNTPEFLAWRRLHLSKAKLEGITEISAVMAGFSVVATVELQINDDPDPYLLCAFTITTSLLVCTTMLTVMSSTCILPHIETVAKLAPYSSAHESPHDSMMFLIDLSWVLGNTLSIFFFTLDVILLCWIKFTYFSEVASWCATILLSSVLFGVCLFGVVFYRRIVHHQYMISDLKCQELEEMKRQLDPPIINV